jgi:hypothetical protein
VKALSNGEAAGLGVPTVASVYETLTGTTKAIALRERLGCGHCHLRMLDMLTTSAATHRGEGMAGVQGPKPQIICPDAA